MEEDKISSDVNDKRKVEDDTSSHKPNPKRIKLVRPVFSPVVKPTISATNEFSKSDIQLTEVSKSVTLSDKISNVVNIPQPSKNLIQDSEIIIKSNDLQTCIKHPVEPLETLHSTDEIPETVNSPIEPFETVKSQSKPIETIKSLVEPTETIKSPVEPLEDVKTTVELLESVNKHIEPLLVTSIVNEEQADSSSDALEIPNIFSEETKKELENLKKNIFKIEDDGSSSENDSQSKRPRLKRPTFVISSNENKVESNNPIVLDKISETSNLNLVKLEEEIYTIDSTTEININNLTEKIDESLIANEEKDNSIIIENIIEKKTIKNENIDQVLEEKFIKIENINRVFKEEPIESAETTEFINIKKLNELENGEILIIKKKAEENTIELENECEVTQNLVDIELKNIKTNVKNEEKSIEKEQLNMMVEMKPTDLGKVNSNVEESITTQVVTDEKEIFEKTFNNKITHNNILKNVKVVLEKYIETNSEDEDNEISTEIKNKSVCEENTTINDKIKNEIDVKHKIIDIVEDIQFNTAFKTIKNEEDTNLEIEKSCISTQLINENNPSSDVSSKQNNEEYESQIHKSDILKAALMAKKSLESLVNTSNNQVATDIHPTSLVIKKSDILPKIGEEAIVNKIEAEIKLSTQDQPTSNKNSHDKIINNVVETNNFKEISSSHCFIENNTVNKNDEPPKWGSAKMNEVEKFLNDSNVTITPINKPQETPKLGKITLKLPKMGNPEIKTETTVRPDVKSELIKKITSKQIAGDNPIKSVLSQPSNSFSDFATIRPAPKPSAEQIALLKQQILNTPKKRGRPSKALAQQKQLLLQYQQQQLHIVQEGSVETGSDPVFHAPLFDMEDMSEGTGMFNLFDTSTPKRGKSIRGKGSRGRRGRGGGSIRGRDESDSDTASKISRMDDEVETYHQEMNEDEETKQAALIEAERLRKEEAREKKLEERKKRIKERYDLMKEKKLKKKLKAEERRLQWHENKRLMQEEKARAAEMKKSLPPPQNFDDETRMSADCNNSRSQTPARHFMMGMLQL